MRTPLASTSRSSTATGSISEHMTRSPALDVLELMVVCNCSLNSVPSGTVISSTAGLLSCAKRGAVMLPTSEQEISKAKNFAFIPISPKHVPTACLVQPDGRGRIGHYHRQRPTQSKTKSSSDSKALVWFDAGFVPEFGWVVART